MMSIVTIIFFFQSMYLGEFYTDNKISNLSDNLNGIAKQYAKNEWNNETLAREMSKFSDANNANINLVYDYQNDFESFINDTGAKNDNKIFIVTILINDNYYDTYIDNEIIENALDGQMVLKYDEIDIRAYKEDDELITLTKINGYDLGNEIEGEFGTLIIGTGKIVDIKLISEGYLDNSYLENSYWENDILIDSYVIEGNIFDMYGEFNNSVNDISYRINAVPFVNNKEVYMIKNIIDPLGKQGYFLVESSLQPVDEVIKVFNKYYIIFYILSAIIALVISKFYSQYISKPVLKLTSTANDMANMNFDLRLDEGREDELGDLARSLNSLSTNLDTALQDLKEANEQLVFDIEKEKKQDLIRKEFVAYIP